MKTHRIGIIMNGVTGRMGTNQHLIRSIKAIIDQRGGKLSDNEVIMPDPVLVGRSEEHNHAVGTVFRVDDMRRLATGAGFANVEVLPIEHDSFRFYRLGG